MNDFIASLPKKIDKFIEILIDYNGYVKVLQGLQNTLKIAVLGLIIGIVIGTLIATVRVIPKYKVLPRILNAICAFYVALFRGTPMVVQLLIFYYVVLPIMGVNLPSVSVAIAVFGLNSGAYISEIMRSGIQSVDDGQMEGGRSVGLSFSTTMMRIVIPQAIKNILPTLGNEFIAMLKDSSLVSVIGFEELTRSGQLVIAETYGTMEIWTCVAILYLVMTITISQLVGWLEKRYRLSDER